MNTYPFLLGVTMLFWGWQTGLLIPAVVCALILEGSRSVTLWISFDEKKTDRVIVLCTVLIVCSAVYYVAVSGGNYASAFMSFVKWTPLALFPLMFVQAYGAEARIDINRLFLLSSRKSTDGRGKKPRYMNISFPYLILVVIATAASNMRDQWFYIGIIVISFWALWYQRARAFGTTSWLAAFAVAAAIGYFAHIQLHQLQVVVENFVSEQFAASGGDDVDPFKTSTSMGRIGRLKMSDRIIMRVVCERDPRLPLLFHEVNYSQYASARWTNKQTGYVDIANGQVKGTWLINNTPAQTQAMHVDIALSDGKGVLPLPSGTARIERLNAAQVRATPSGAVTVEGTDDPADFTVRYLPDSVFLSFPDTHDTQIPRGLLPVVSAIADELKLRDLPPAVAVQTLTDYFAKNYSYSTYQGPEMAGPEPLKNFLHKKHAGHCEYFATATALILRAANIPARYAAGYSMQEYSALEKAYIIRAKHAHAWVLAYVDGAWREIDTTPATWYAFEREQSSVLRPLLDVCSWAWHRLVVWHGSWSGGAFMKYVYIICISFIFFAAWKLYRSKRRRRRQHNVPAAAAQMICRGTDSELYGIEKYLADTGLGRLPSESLRQWFRRTTQAQVPEPETLARIIDLHYQYRFDPQGLNPEERAELKQRCREWMNIRHEKNAPAKRQG